MELEIQLESHLNCYDSNFAELLSQIVRTETDVSVSPPDDAWLNLALTKGIRKEIGTRVKDNDIYRYTSFHLFSEFRDPSVPSTPPSYSYSFICGIGRCLWAKQIFEIKIQTISFYLLLWPFFLSPANQIVGSKLFLMLTNIYTYSFAVAVDVVFICCVQSRIPLPHWRPTRAAFQVHSMHIHYVLRFVLTVE